MRHAAKKHVALAALALILALGAGSAAPAQERLVVVELFTSQGCSSCPPADALLGELAKRNDVLALGQHVDYWDYIGWKDPFASPLTTERQRRYSARLGRGYVYTPQMVIHGLSEAVGSERDTVERQIARALAQARHHPVRAAYTGAQLLRIELPASQAPVAGEVFLVGYDLIHMTRVLRGENGGRTLNDHNVVRSFERVGAWSGKAATIELPAPAPDPRRAWAVVVQGENGGPILGAARVPQPPTN